MMSEVERVKQHYSDVLQEIIEGADSLHKSTPATKMTRDLMRMQRDEVSQQIKHLATFLSQVYSQVQEITIDEEGQ